MGVVSRYIDILTIIINFPYSTCISSFLAAASLYTSLFIFKMFFRSLVNNAQGSNRSSNFSQDLKSAILGE